MGSSFGRAATNLPLTVVDSHVIRPECVATSSPRIASTRSWDAVLAAAERVNPRVIFAWEAIG